MDAASSSMNDFLGNPLAIGDTVALNAVRYRNLIKGTVARFTPKGMQVDIGRARWPAGTDDREYTYRTPAMVCKVATC